MAEVGIKLSPENLIEWSFMEDWENGTTSAPTEHTLSGAGATIAREATIVKVGTYSAAVTRVGNDTTLYHDFPDYADYTGRKMTFRCWVYATVASRGRIAISDGVGSTESSYHTGGSSWEELTVTHDVDSSATRIRVEMQVNTGNTTVYFDGGMLVDGPVAMLDLTSSTQDVSGWDVVKQYELNSYEAARRDGMQLRDSRVKSVKFRLPGKIVGTTAEAARTSFDTFMKTFNSVRIKPDGQHEFRYLYRFTDRYWRVRAEGIDPDYSKSAMAVIDYNMKFEAEEPFERYIQKLRDSQTIASSPHAYTITTNGSAFSRPFVTVTAGAADITALTIENMTSGQKFSYSGTISSGNDLEWDADDLTVKNNAVGDLANVSNETQMILLPGANEMKVTITGGSTDSTIKVDWYDRWH